MGLPHKLWGCPISGGAASDDHLQLPRVFDDLRGQLGGGDGGVLGLLLLLHPKAVVVVGAQDPTALWGDVGQKGGGWGAAP